MSKPIVAGALFLAIAGFAIADTVFIVEEKPWSSMVASINNNSEEEGSSSSQAGPKGVAKMKGSNVLQITESMGYVPQETTDTIFISSIIQDAQVEKRLLMKDGDRAGIVSWVDSPKVKAYYLALKEALHVNFTPAIKDLVDETQRRENKPPRNFLTFIDTGISEERIAFARVRERLYEVRIAPGKEEMMFELLDELTK